MDIISEEEFAIMRKQALLQNKITGYKSSTLTEDYVDGYASFGPYAQTQFTQVNGCGPTAAANLLSFYQQARGVNLFSGNSITQNQYNTLCDYVKWTPNGTSIYNVSNGLINYCNSIERHYTIDTYLLIGGQMLLEI